MLYDGSFPNTKELRVYISMNTQDEILVIENVTMSYGGVSVIHDINLNIKKGEFFGLIGLNGAGKTTLIKSIVALKTYEKGKVRIFGEACDHKESKTHMAFLPERFEPPWFLTGIEFLRFSLRLYGQVFCEEKVIKASEDLALDSTALGKRVQTYSKGMRQKLGLLGTILTNCDLMILDEPMSGLDPLARTRVKDVLSACKTHDQTIFMSSHILSDMDEICDRVAVLHDGRLCFVGAPDELKNRTNERNLERAFLHFIEKDKAA